jgi:hypothetical protein
MPLVREGSSAVGRGPVVNNLAEVRARLKAELGADIDYVMSHAAAIAMPGFAKARRFEGPGAGISTGLAEPFESIDVPWQTFAGAPEMIFSPDIFVCTLERAHSGCLRYNKPISTSYEYKARFDGGALGGTDAEVEEYPTGVYPEFYYFGCDDPAGPHGPQMSARRGVTGHSLVWLDGTDTSPAEIRLERNGGTSFPASALFRIMKQFGENLVERDITPSSGLGTATVRFEIKECGWYNIAANYDESIAGVVSNRMYVVYNKDANSNADCLVLQDVTDLGDFETAISAIRMNAGSLFFKNLAAEGYQMGQIVQRTTNMAIEAAIGLSQEPSTTPLDMFNYVATMSGAVTREASAGCYSHLLTGDSTSSEMRNLYSDEAGRAERALLPVCSNSPKEIIVIKIPLPSGIVPVATNPRNMRLTVNYAVEYTTNSRWFDVAQPGLKVNEYMVAAAVANRLENHFDNAFHLSDIWKGIKKAIGTISNVAGAIAPAAGEFGPLLAAGSNIGNMIAGRPGK